MNINGEIFEERIRKFGESAMIIFF